MPAWEISILTLTRKNQELLERLEVAEQWIGREFSDRKLRTEKEAMQDKTRLDLTETGKNIEIRIQNYFDISCNILWKENLELLRDSEINFNHIVRNKELDGFLVTNNYQKIIENLFEIHVTSHFRSKYKKTRLHPGKNNLLEKTIYKVLHNNFQLSLGKTYQILESIMEGSEADLIKLYQNALQELPANALLSDPEFWEAFSACMHTDAFWEKRHSGKISFTDVIKLRKIMTWNFEEEWFIKKIIWFFDTKQNM